MKMVTTWFLNFQKLLKATLKSLKSIRKTYLNRKKNKIQSSNHKMKFWEKEMISQKHADKNC